MPDDIRGMSFEQAMDELEAIVRGLETGRGDLDAAITAYERGAVLKRHCEAKLAAAQKRVERMTRQADGSLAATPMVED